MGGKIMRDTVSGKINEQVEDPQMLCIWEEAEPSLEELQKFVGGYIEVVRCRDGSQLIVNDRGLLDQLPLNETATMYNMVFGNGDNLVGNVVWLGKDSVLT
jgi:hypothetical protein